MAFNWIARLETKFTKLGPDDCWLWQGTINKKGYGHFRINGETMRAHRVSFIAYKGPIPSGMFVCHTCDVRHCVNPNHLWLGTHADNMEDLKKKNRIPKG